jgi:hypothetical protein
MAAKKVEKKLAVKKVAAGKKTAQPKAVSGAATQKQKAEPGQTLPEKPQAQARKPIGPTARACPLVLDGEVDAADFSPSDCLTCSEFDCRFSEAEGSGPLRSRLFASGDEGDEEGDDGWGGDIDFGGFEEAGEDDEGEEGDLL